MTAANDNFAIYRREGCCIVYGSISLDAMRDVIKQIGIAATVDRNAAQILGADMVVGTPKNLARLRRAIHYNPIAL